MVIYRKFQEDLMKTLTSTIACVLLLVGSLSIAAKEPQETPEDIDLASKDEATGASSVDAQEPEDSLSAYERALRAQEEAEKAQDEATRAQVKAQKAFEEARESEELKEWHEAALRRSEAASVRFRDALDALTASGARMQDISRVAPLIAASQPSVDAFRDDLAVTLRNRAAATTGGFIGIRMGESTSQGIVIDEVVENSPAEESGLLAGDVVSAIDGIDIQGAKNPSQALTALIQSVEPGSEIELEIVRNKKKITLLVGVGRRNQQTAWTAYSLSLHDNYSSVISLLRYDRKLVLLEFEEELGHYFGMEFGILVVDTPKDSQLQVGDLLLRIDDKPVRSISHAERFLRSAEETTEFTVKRQGKTKKLDIASSGLRISDVRDM